METFFLELPLSINILLIAVALCIVTRASYFLVDGAVHIAREFRISPLVIGATVVAMGTSSAELAVNLNIVLGKDDTAAVVGNILGSNLINFGIELGVSALIAGLIIVPREAIERDIPLYLAGTGMLTAIVIDGEISQFEAIPMLTLFGAALVLIIQCAQARSKRSVLLVEVTEIETISHPTAQDMTRLHALLALFGGLVTLILASRLLIFNTTSLAVALEIPEYVIGMVLIGPGTSLPEIASSIQAARRGHAGLVLGTAFGSNLFNLLFGLGLPALIRPLAVGDTAVQSFIFMNAINISLMVLFLLDFEFLGRTRTINRVVGAYLIITYVGYIAYELVAAAGGTTTHWVTVLVALLVASALVWWSWDWLHCCFGMPEMARAAGGTILCATRGGKSSQPTHEQAIKLARETDANLIFLYVFDQHILQKSATPIVINVEEQVKQMLNYLQCTAQEQADRAGVPTRVIVRTGNLRNQLKEIADEEDDVSLIVLGSPAGASSLFQLEALHTFVEEVEAEIGVPVQIVPQETS
ncbi:MAG: calcium/sodium antiporter [Anaerolineae bacterium]|nr:calcium/sodium antiporter [Anaerolineae bacterium]